MFYKLILIFLVNVLHIYRNQVTGIPLTSNKFTGIFNDSNDDLEVVKMVTNKLPEIQDPKIIDLSHYGNYMYGQPDVNKTGTLVGELRLNKTPVNPEELGSYLEGDILIPQGSITFRNGLSAKSYRWSDGVVPFEIADDFTSNELDVIASAINEYHDKTCIRFKIRTTESDYIFIAKGYSGCWSGIGRLGGKQQVNLQAPGCLIKVGTAIHELMHVLGFMHEQNRKERNSFVDIQFQNVMDNAASNFLRMPNTMAFGVGYDYGSVMHYSPNAFSSNGQPTIVAKKPVGRQVMGQRDGFSPLDIEKVNRMYNCKNKIKQREPPIKLPERVPSLFPYAQQFKNTPIGTLVNNFFNSINRIT